MGSFVQFGKGEGILWPFQHRFGPVGVTWSSWGNFGHFQGSMKIHHICRYDKKLADMLQ